MDIKPIQERSENHLNRFPRLALIALATISLLLSCAENESVQRSIPEVDYSLREYWYDNGRNIDESLVDVFYVLPTCVHTWEDESGRTHALADPLRQDQRERMIPSYELADGIFASEANYFAPYYHQVTLEGWQLPEDSLMELSKIAMEDICQAFDYYLKQENNGRSFILAGFSQGGQGVVELLKHMDDETYSRLIAAYSIGWRITQEDLDWPAEGQKDSKHRKAHIIPAQGAEDTGVTISYNTIIDPETYEGGTVESSILRATTLGAASCINPYGWTLSEEPQAVNDSVSIRLSKEHQILLVSGLDPKDYFIESLADMFPYGNLHLQELTFFKQQLQDNVLLRAYGKE